MTVVAFPGHGAVVPFPKKPARRCTGVAFVCDGNFFTDVQDKPTGEILWAMIQQARQKWIDEGRPLLGGIE